MAIDLETPAADCDLVALRRRATWLTGRLLVAITVSFTLHAGAAVAALVIGVFVLPSVSISEAGRNSIALVASIEQISPEPAPIETESEFRPVVLHVMPSRRTTTLVVERPLPPAERWTPPSPTVERPETTVEVERIESIELVHLPARAEVDLNPQPPSESRPPPLPKAEIALELKVEEARTAPSSQASPASTTMRGADVDETPQPVFNPSPSYPREALTAGLTGRVVLVVTVNAGGSVTAAEVYKSSGHDILDRAALAAVRLWRFAPARRGGVAVEHTIAAPVRFVIPR